MTRQLAKRLDRIAGIGVCAPLTVSYQPIDTDKDIGRKLEAHWAQWGMPAALMPVTVADTGEWLARYARLQ